MSPAIWTDDPLVPNVTRIRKVHIDELREHINSETVRRGGSATSWSETIEAGATKTRNLHLNELRSAMTSLQSRLSPCATNTVGPPVYTPPNPMTHTTPDSKVRYIHIEELRKTLNEIEVQCFCDCHGHCACVSHSHCSCAGMAHCCCQGHGCSSVRYKKNIRPWGR
jgi:hypothetical protein